VLGRLATTQIALPFRFRPERLVLPAQLVTTASLLWFATMGSGSVGKFARLLGPSILLLLGWAWIGRSGSWLLGDEGSTRGTS
jgi:hypothetical protein